MVVNIVLGDGSKRVLKDVNRIEGLLILGFLEDKLVFYKGKESIEFYVCDIIDLEVIG